MRTLDTHDACRMNDERKKTHIKCVSENRVAREMQNDTLQFRRSKKRSRWTQSRKYIKIARNNRPPLNLAFSTLVREIHFRRVKKHEKYGVNGFENLSR